MEWAQKRKIIYALVFAGVLILLASYPVYLVVNKTPTCFDKKQNGTEMGVDCGGGCALQCATDIKAPRVAWVKAFPLGGNQYDLGAYVENPNVNAGIKSIHYTMRVFDRAGQALVEKRGTTEFAPSSAVLLFETGVTLGGEPSRADVVFNGDDLALWSKASISPSIVLIKNQNLTQTDTKPRFDAVLVNTDPIEDVTGLTLGAIVYDADRNPVAISRTYVDTIPKKAEHPVVFTWPNKFTSTHESFITEIVVTPRAFFAQ